MREIRHHEAKRWMLGLLFDIMHRVYRMAETVDEVDDLTLAVRYEVTKGQRDRVEEIFAQRRRRRREVDPRRKTGKD